MSKRTNCFTVVIVLISTVFLQACSLFSIPGYHKIENLQPQMEAKLGRPVFYIGEFCLNNTNDCYALHFNERLFYYHDGKKTQIEPCVAKMVPLGDGVVYLRQKEDKIDYRTDNGLYYANQGDCQLVSKNASVFCGDGTHVYYFDKVKKCVFNFDGQNSELLFEVRELEQPRYGGNYMLANDSWIILFTYEGTYQYNKKTSELTRPSFLEDLVYDKALLYDNRLIRIGTPTNGGTIYDLTTGRENVFDLGANFAESSIDMRCASYDDRVFVSISNITYEWKEFDYTISIDCKTDTVEVINDRFYENLLCSDEGLYGGTVYKMKRII